MIEMHGSLWRVKTLDYEGFVPKEGKCWEDKTMPLVPSLGGGICESDLKKDGKDEVRIPLESLPKKEEGGEKTLLRPAVVWFGESLDKEIRNAYKKVLKNCDLLLIIGTSCVVYPAASFGVKVKNRGGKVADFNLEKAGSHSSDFTFLGKAGETLPKILDVQIE